MIGSADAVPLAWASVYAGLAAFFLILAPRFRGRGYDFLGWTMAGVAVSALGTWLLLRSGPSLSALVGARMVLLGATFASAFNTHFVVRFTRQHRIERFAWLGYALSGAAVLADVAIACETNLDSLQFPKQFSSQSGLLTVFVTVLFAAHVLFDACLLGLAVRRGMSSARWPFLLVAFLGPAIVFDVDATVRQGSYYYIAEVVTWVYGLVIVAALLSELRGAEGLLERTTSSLAERTAELEISYAEIELMHTELSRKEQLAAVGELAAAIAHEVRNPLAIIMNAASGLRRRTLSENDKATLLSIVDEESARLNQLVTELLRFAQPVTAARAPASLLDICKQMQSEVPDGYELSIVKLADLSIDTAMVDPGLFRLALDNLVSNAAQAMPLGGKITITLAPTTLSDGTPAASVAVSDTGQGMTAADLERARKPFFTTRPRGTGLGLPIVDRILEAHAGEVEIQSEYAVGTTVTLKVPLEPESPPPSARYPGSASPSQRRRYRSAPQLVFGENRESSPGDAPLASPAPDDQARR